MYQNLTPWLVGLLVLAVLAMVVIALRQPVSRRLALRQIARRPTEATLVVLGSVLGTAIIVGSLVVGDTLNHSVRQTAYDTLGPVDERIISPNSFRGEAVALTLDGLRADHDVDGVLTARAEQAALARAGTGGTTLAEPRTLAWDVDFADASRFGAAGSAPGLSGPSPAPGEVVLNRPLADSVHARPGDQVSLYVYGRPLALRVARVVPDQGLAGVGFGASVNRNAFLAPGTLSTLAAAAGTDPRWVTFVSNRGGVESGEPLTGTVKDKIAQRIGVLTATSTIEAPKQDVLRAAQQTGDALGALFLFIGSFSIIAGVLLLVTIFVMLAEERKPQLGMVRAVGMKRSRLVGAFSLEGAVYGALAALLGVGVGVLVGSGVAYLAARIFGGFSIDRSGLRVSFAVTPVSLINGFAMGLLIAVVTVLLTSARISRFNIIGAIRDLPATAGRKPRRRVVALYAALALLFAVAAVPAIANSNPVGTFLLPALAILCAVPVALRMMSRRVVVSAAAGAVLVWTLLVNVLRPTVYDSASVAVYVIVGVLLTFSAVLLVTENQNVVLAPLRPLLRQSSERGLAARLGVAYPLARRFRTGATLIMYAIVVFTLVLITEISGVIGKAVDTQVADATAGYTLRVDFNPAAPVPDPARTLRDGPLAGQVTAVAPLVTAPAQATDPGGRTDQPLLVNAVGVPPESGLVVPFQDRMSQFTSDAAVWLALQGNPQYVVVDQSFGATGGPPGNYVRPGATFAVTDPSTGRTEQKTIAGLIRTGIPFYAATGDPAAIYPVLMSQDALRDEFPNSSRVSAALLATAPGVSPDALATQLQGSFLRSSLVATPIASTVRRLFAANASFFQLMQGFLALGLLVGVTALGVLMVRAVRERRRTIGVLRALGFQSRTVRRAFLAESAFIAAEGIVLGAVLAVLTTWLMYQKSTAFSGVRSGFPITWLPILIVVVGTFLASLLATLGPARRAASIRPALAVRVAE